MKNIIFVIVLLFAGFIAAQEKNTQYTEYTGDNLNRIAFPIGGLGTGMYCLEGTGAISHVSIKSHMEFFNEPVCYAAICVVGETPEKNVARVVEATPPDWKFFGRPGSGLGSVGTTYGLPRFRNCSFQSRFPFATIRLSDAVVPVTATITGWSPFTPPDADSSSLPAGALEYSFTNPTEKTLRCIFSFNSRNFVNNNGSIGSVNGGFVLYDQTGENRTNRGAFAVFADGEEKVIVDHCWFRGGWFDSFTVAWDNVTQGRIIDNPPVTSGNMPGATLAVPFELAPGATKTIRLLTAWYWNEPTFNVGHRNVSVPINAFKNKLSQGTARNQQPVSGFIGRGLVNTFDPNGDAPQGTLISPEFSLDKQFLHLLVGGGQGCRVSLFVDGKQVHTASGNNTEHLQWVSWKLADFHGKKGVIKIIDSESGGWGHILCDHIVLSDEPVSKLKTDHDNEIINDPKRIRLLADFETGHYGDWQPEKTEQKEQEEPTYCIHGKNCQQDLMICSDEPIPDTYKPWYTMQFDSVTAVAEYWRNNYADLKTRSELFAKTFYDTTLPPEVIESVVANLSILKSPTVLRQHDGRLWCWEGCEDNRGSCHGTCTHVWNYAQALCHLFPAMERSLRQTEYFESSSDNTGRQSFRANLPISPGGGAFDAADGQLGGIMKIYREWRILGNNNWLKIYWNRVRLSLDYMIEKWDPRHTGLLEESHHNTYDINYFGPDGHCGSFYLGALAAAVEMGTFLNDDVSLYKELLEKGSKRFVTNLFNGEYFVQKVWKDGLNNNFHPINPSEQPLGYKKIAEIINEQGAKYQYGNGCLSDGVLGFWIARCCGLETDWVPREMVEKHLLSVYKYNLRQDLSEHANPQRPTFAMGNDGGLLLCSWHHGDKPMLPFVYSDEVWTGIEYQVASHLMMFGHVDKGLEIVRLIRKRYNGIRRNPFNEYECGHWYARAMSSYGMLQGLTGVRYDAVTKTLYVDSKVGDFRSFLSTATGYGTVEYKNGKINLSVVSGNIPVEKIKELKILK
ncbi:MAG: hypothetical protein LBU34_11805 [Planctomycetaceae bacterium]|jgi:uncharacterized protein (DUF608 family)|nr:hypothetical protein [Planctomycetaceae bacterium]